MPAELKTESLEKEAISQSKPEESKELAEHAETKEQPLTKKIKRKLKRSLRKPENQTNKNKIVIIDGKEVLMIPSSFEIMTENGWKPIMMRADKIHKE